MEGQLNAFPAHAGMNRFGTGLSLLLKGVPRTRGDEPKIIHDGAHFVKRSPHTRG